jgi:purine-nucleoside phosphorylase
MSSSLWLALFDACLDQPPQTVIVLGSGLGSIVASARPLQIVPFAEIPGLPAASVHGHRGLLTLGEWGGQRVLVFEGRLHHYEGHSWDMVVRPIQIAASLGVRLALFTNAVGGIAGPLTPGSLMVVRDHLEWTRPNFWRYPGPGGLGPSRPSPYSQRLRTLLLQHAAQNGIELHEGLYAAVTGPSYETPAEIRALRAWGADAVGMSTAREVKAGVDAGLECAAVSCITNRAAGLDGRPLDHREVLATASAQGARLAALMESLLNELRASSRPDNRPG